MASTITRADLRLKIRQFLELWPDTAILDGNIETTEQTLKIRDSAHKDFIASKCLLEIDSEVMRVFANPAKATALRVMRGYKNSTKATHPDGTEIKVYPSWGWTDYELNQFIIPDAIRWLKPYAWSQQTSADFSWTSGAREADLPAASGISYPDGNQIIRVQDKQSGIYYPFGGWQLVGDTLYFRKTASQTRTLRCIYAKFQAVLSDDTTALDNDQFAEAIALYAAHLCINNLKTNRVRFAEFSASLNDRVSTVDEIVRMAYDLKNQAILSREENGRVMPAGFVSTYRE